MTKAQHTPGPWTAEITPSDCLARHRVFGPKHKDGSNYAALCETNKAEDAHLIAAAPELLASCIAMMKYMESGFLVRNVKDDAKSDWALKALSFVKDLNVMHAAIAKASSGTKAEAA